jgi:hypothetical protein
MTSVDGDGHRIASLSTLNSGGFKVNVQIVQLFDKVNYITLNVKGSYLESLKKQHLNGGLCKNYTNLL